MGHSSLGHVNSEPTTGEVSESLEYRLYRTTCESQETVTVPLYLDSDAIIVTFWSELICSPSMMDEPKTLSSWPKDTTDVVLLKGAQIKHPIGGC